MSGTVTGGRKAAAKNKERHGADFYKKIGSQGGSRTAADGVIKGFAAMDKEKHREASIKGGSISRRPPAKKSKIEAKETKPPVWVQPNQNSTSLQSTTNQILPCASCGESYNASELDEARLCPNCPEVHHVPRRWPFNLKRPF